MTLVMLGCIPLMGVMGAFMARAISDSTKKQNAAYARAAMVAQQSIGLIWRVVAYTPVGVGEDCGLCVCGGGVVAHKALIRKGRRVVAAGRGWAG